MEPVTDESRRNGWLRPPKMPLWEKEKDEKAVP